MCAWHGWWRGGGPRRLRRALRRCDPSPDGTGGDTVVDHIRLFPLRDDVRWTYRVHEQILPALRRANVPVRWTDLTVRHTGYVDKELRARKLERDIAILQRELEERPDDPFVLFNLGAIAVERCDWRKALWFLERSLAGSKPADSIVRKLFALIARAHQMMGDTQAALETCAKGLEVNPEDAELWFRKAVVHRHRGESSEAEKCWRLILTLEASRPVLQRRPGHLRPPDPAQPGRAGRRARRSRRDASGCGRRCWPNARAIARHWRGWGVTRKVGYAHREPARPRPVCEAIDSTTKMTDAAAPRSDVAASAVSVGLRLGKSRLGATLQPS